MKLYAGEHLFFIMIGSFVRWGFNKFRDGQRFENMDEDGKNFWIGVLTVLTIFVILPLSFKLIISIF